MAKYKNKKVTHDGITFDSKKERDYYLVLKAGERAGEIANLELQKSFELIPRQDGERAVNYIADFAYYDLIDKRQVVVDVKSKITRKLPAYIIKRKLMLFIYKIKIVEI